MLERNGEIVGGVRSSFAYLSKKCWLILWAIRHNFKTVKVMNDVTGFYILM